MRDRERRGRRSATIKAITPRISKPSVKQRENRDIQASLISALGGKVQGIENGSSALSDKILAKLLQ